MGSGEGGAQQIGRVLRKCPGTGIAGPMSSRRVGTQLG